MKKSKHICVLLWLILTVAAPLSAVDFGLSVHGGAGSLTGVWRDEISVFSRDFGQEPKPFPYPVFGAYFDVLFRPLRPLVLGLSVGAGSWGGCIVSDGGSAAVRYSSIAVFGFEFAPVVGFRLPAGKGEAGANLRLGLGSYESGLSKTDSWNGIKSVVRTELEIEQLIFIFTSLSAGYAFPLGSFSLACEAFCDVASGLISSSVEPDTLFRFGVGLRIGRSLDFARGKN